MKSTISMFLVAAMAFSCGKKKDDDAAGPVPGPNGNSDDATGATLTKEQIQKNWATECVASIDSKGPAWKSSSSRVVRNLKLEGDKFTLTMVGFHSETCEEDKVQVLFVTTGTFKLGQETTGQFNAETHVEKVKGSEIDFTVESLSGGALSQDAVGWMNIGAGYCGHTDWTAGNVIELTPGAECNPFADTSLRAFSKVTMRDNKLFVGAYYEEENIGSTADKRPTKWAVTEGFAESKE